MTSFLEFWDSIRDLEASNSVRYSLFAESRLSSSSVLNFCKGLELGCCCCCCFEEGFEERENESFMLIGGGSLTMAALICC